MRIHTTPYAFFCYPKPVGATSCIMRTFYAGKSVPLCAITSLFMINRKLIRIKTVQVVYSLHLNDSCRVEEGENILLSSLETAYDLYNTMLTLMVEISRLALRTYESQCSRARRLGLPLPSRKFVDNRFMLQLGSNRQLRDYRQSQRIDWVDEEEFVRSLYLKVTDSDFYREYMESITDSYEEDRELCRKIYRHIIVGNEDLDNLLEDVNLYWNDDRFIIDTFVIKTINRFTAESNDDQPLLPEFSSEEDLEFARKLFSQTLLGADYYCSLIAQSTRRWDVERVPLMDRIILQVALAEITSCPSIPLSVSINEYIEIAKSYSTPNSARYINATLDHISKQLIKENKLVKAGLE